MAFKAHFLHFYSARCPVELGEGSALFTAVEEETNVTREANQRRQHPVTLASVLSGKSVTGTR